MACRCAICDNVSDPAIASSPHNIYLGLYYQDPKDRTKLICGECIGEIDSAMEDFVGDAEEEPDFDNTPKMGHYIQDGEVKRNASKWKEAPAE